MRCCLIFNLLQLWLEDLKKHKILVDALTTTLFQQRAIKCWGACINQSARICWQCQLSKLRCERPPKEVKNSNKPHSRIGTCANCARRQLRAAALWKLQPFVCERAVRTQRRRRNWESAIRDLSPRYLLTINTNSATMKFYDDQPFVRALSLSNEQAAHMCDIA